jgi:hypothetical protein
VSAGPLLEAREFRLPADLLDVCLEALREHGREGAELFIGLSATQDPEARLVEFRRALIPEQISHTTPYGLLVTIDGEAIFALNRDCHEKGELLAGQIHAHPREAYHSETDDSLAMLRLPGSLSLVVPNFGVGPQRLKRWSINQLGADLLWGSLPEQVELTLT